MKYIWTDPIYDADSEYCIRFDGNKDFYRKKSNTGKKNHRSGTPRPMCPDMFAVRSVVGVLKIHGFIVF